MTPDERTLDDGFGNVWKLCGRRECGLEIVRPGKVQCQLCDDLGEEPWEESA